MSVNERIKIIIDSLEEGVNSRFAKKIGTAPTVVGTFLPGGRESKPGFELLVKILEAYPQLRNEWLLFGNGPMFKNGIEPPVKSEVQEPKAQYGKSGGMPAVVTVDSQGRDNVPLVNVKARAGYLSSYADPEFIESLPSYRLPGVDHGTFRMFEVEGQSMYPTLKQRDLVVAEWVERLDHMRDERIYIIVTHSEGIVIKRCINRLHKYGYIIAKSDNANKAEYPDLEIRQEDIQEIWYARWYMSTQFPAPSDLYNRMTNLEVEMHQLRNLIS